MSAQRPRLLLDASEIATWYMSPDFKREFVAFVSGIATHHEFPAFIERLVSLVPDEIIRRNVEGIILLQAWRASKWSPDDWIGTAQNAGPSGDTLVGKQHGPLIYPAGFPFRARLPAASSMLAAQLFFVLESMQLKVDWPLLALLASVSGVPGPSTPESLRGSAIKIVRAKRQGKVLIALWPQDMGVAPFFCEVQGRKSSEPVN